MNKNFVLIVNYECGRCAFLTNTDNLEEALKEFREVQEKRFETSLKDKSFSLPLIISAEIYRIVK